jgi:cyclase
MLSSPKAVRVLHPPAAHTDGDSLIFFRRSNVISTGDVFTTTAYPRIDVSEGGTIQGEIDALNQARGRPTCSSRPSTARCASD